MANRTTANLLKAQAKLMAAFQTSELRFRYPATYLAIKAMSPQFFSNLAELRLREDRTVETNYNVRNKQALGTGGRTHNHTGTKSDTAVLTPTWASYNRNFNMSLKQADNSLYDESEQMFSELSNVVADFMEGYETQATSYLFNNRSGVNIATAEGTFDATDDVFEIAVANEARAMQITKIAMDANKYGAGSVIFCDSISYAKFEYQAAQGAANQSNLSFQFNGVTFIHSVELGALGAGLVSAYAKGFWIVVPSGTVGIIPWIPKQNRVGVDNYPIATYSNIMNPIDGETYAFHSYSEAGNDTANNGYAQDVVTQYEVSQDISFSKAPLSVAGETTIFAFAIV